MREENLSNIIISSDACYEGKFYQGYENRTLFQAKPKENRNSFLKNYSSDSSWMEFTVRIEM